MRRLVTLAVLTSSLTLRSLAAEPLKDWYAGTPTTQGVDRWSIEDGDSSHPILRYVPGGRYGALWSHFKNAPLPEGKTLTVKVKVRIAPPANLTSGLLSFGLFQAPQPAAEAERFLGNDLASRQIGTGWEGFFVSRYGISQRLEGNTTFYCVGGGNVTGLTNAQTYGEFGMVSELDIVMSVKRDAGEVTVSGTVTDGETTQTFSGTSSVNTPDSFNTFGLMNADFLGASTSLEIVEAEVHVE